MNGTDAHFSNFCVSAAHDMNFPFYLVTQAPHAHARPRNGVWATLVFPVPLSATEERFSPLPQDAFTTPSWVSARSLNKKGVSQCQGASEKQIDGRRLETQRGDVSRAGFYSWGS